MYKRQVVGREYAKEREEETEISEAVFEHYLPRFYGDILPKTFTGTVLSIADKLDTITGMFLAGNIPSGSEDPFALRRRATGIVQSLINREFDIDLGNIINYCISLYGGFDTVSYTHLDVYKRQLMDFQEIIFNLQKYWSAKGCIIKQPMDVEKGAGTFNPDTFLRCLGPEPWKVAYVEPSRSCLLYTSRCV